MGVTNDAVIAESTGYFFFEHLPITVPSHFLVYSRDFSALSPKLKLSRKPQLSHQRNFWQEHCLGYFRGHK